MDNYTPDISKKLIQYLDGELSDQEKVALEKKLSNDENLREELENLRLTREAIRYYGLHDNVKRIRTAMKNEKASNGRLISMRTKITRYVIGIAASVVLILGGYMTYNYFKLTPEKLFASNFQHYELITSRNANVNPSQIIRLYKEKDYGKLVLVKTDSVFSPTELFARAMAFIELNQPDSAIRSFLQLRAINKKVQHPQFSDESDYYLALVYIRNKEFDKALHLLHQIKKNPSHLYFTKVTEKLITRVQQLAR